MKHTSKRLQALVLVLAMCVSFLQIPSFAAETHSDDMSVCNVAIEQDGSFTITRRCAYHLNTAGADCTKTATGKIGATVEKDGKVVRNVKDDKNVAENKMEVIAIESNGADCTNDATVIYRVEVEGKAYKSNQFHTAAATGQHVFAKVPTIKTAAEAEADKDHFEFVSDTATCQAAGKVTYAKKCDSCHKAIASETVAFDSAQKEHAAKMKLDKDGKETEKVDLEEEYVVPATCGTNGAYYAVTKCKYCDAVMNRSGLKPAFATGLHNYEYTVTWNKTELNGKDDALTKQNVTIAGKCSVCGDTINVPATDIVGVDLVKEKTVEPTSNCQPGSKTFIITYKASTPVKGNLDKKTDVKVEATIPYYPATHVHGTDGHVRTGIYVPDEESYVKATCTKDGHYNLVNPCKVCGDKEVVATVKIPATGKHTAAAAKKENVVAATTKKGGSYDLVVRCADCGEIISSTHKTTAKIVVNASKINSVKNYKGKKAKVYLKKAASVIGYQIQYSTRKDFKGAKHVNTRKTSKYLTKLAKKKYYVRVRTYKTVDGKLYYSSWSGAKTVTIKK